MKKLISVLIILVVIFFTAVYFLIPATKTGSQHTLVTSNYNATMRLIINKNKWTNWWPGEKTSDATYQFKNCRYRVDEILLNGFIATVFYGDDSAKVNLQISVNSPDSSDFVWNYSILMPKNPIKKLTAYFNSNKIAENINELSVALKNYFDKQENVYGMKIERKMVTDSTLVSYKKIFDHYPSTEEIYTMITAVKDFIQKNNGEEANYPMLNVHINGVKEFETMVGIPTKTPLIPTGDFVVKRMVLGYILVGEVKGGVNTVREAETQMNNYALEHNKLSPAIPFQSLITDRMMEKDSTKWITKLYYPIFY